jgi:hypothetical protein
VDNTRPEHWITTLLLEVGADIRRAHNWLGHGNIIQCRILPSSFELRALGELIV